MTVSNLRKLDFVVDQLARYAGEMKKLNSASTFVVCPFHSENTPSGRIFHSSTTRSPGYFKCYGCGKGAPWDEVAPMLGLEAYKWAKPTEQFARTVTKEVSDEVMVRKHETQFTDLPKDKVWREIPTNLLIDVGCKKVRHYYPDSDWHGEAFVYMPVIIKGETRGFIRARLRKVKDKPSYLNAKGTWSSDYGLFPYDYAVRNKPKVLVLVEGPRDALWLLYHGIPSMAILGTQAWSARKSRMIELSGAEHVILMMDGDDAGLRAIELIRPQLKKLVMTSVFDLTGKDSPYWQFRKEAEPSKAAKEAGISLWDPQSLPRKKIKQLQQLVQVIESGLTGD